MSVGIVLSAFNHFYFRRYVSVFHEFLPQMMFLQARGRSRPPAPALFLYPDTRGLHNPTHSPSLATCR
jgi:hypothetical protein